ncbi:hypothetical protein Mp_4g07650 [Marchantia polymorpha subsp. ruderalis]|uniref:Uncharacterized protein n=2 Tax=Marchantia polymorpha TaxID=3197 RepID=A0AAF6B7I1_MARPO|nr:hypothetical protein MARPO_0115s0016 [Marchantia polymorpha]BBN07965.1 hypothetical protein Mp_4g07650 [Marchantia polymorpha subsp. ruderalis]|eukprot:PTQ31089.1 hypothetical protein MARPO_0115s0016 [Marchantia polymorpha]
MVCWYSSGGKQVQRIREASENRQEVAMKKKSLLPMCGRRKQEYNRGAALEPLLSLMPVRGKMMKTSLFQMNSASVVTLKA